MGKAIRESSICTRLGQKYQIGNAYSLHENRTLLVCVCGRYELAGKKQNIDTMEKVRKTLIWENRHHSLTRFISVALTENVKQTKIL